MTTDVAIELGELATHACACCGGETETVHGYLYASGGATAVYFASYARAHAVRTASMLVSIGGWGDGTGPADRRAIPLAVEVHGEDAVLTFTDAEASPWHGEDFLGEMRAPEALSAEERETAVGLARVALREDPRLASYVRC